MKKIYAARKIDGLGRQIADPPKMIFSDIDWNKIPPLAFGLEGEQRQIPRQGWVEITKQEFEGKPIKTPKEFEPDEKKPITVKIAKERIQAVKDGEKVTASELLEALEKLKNPIEGAETMPFSELIEAVKNL